MLFVNLVTAISVKGEFEIIYVDDDNIAGPWLGTIEHPYRYIQDAIEHASQGDIIRVYAGSYLTPDNNVYITKTLSVIGNGSDDTLIECLVSISADDVFFSGFTVKGYDYETGKRTCSIRLKNSDNCDIKNNTIASGLCCIELYDSHNNNIENNMIVERIKDKPGIYLFSSNANMIRKNLIDSSDFGIYLDHCQYNIVDDNNFTEGETAMTIHSSNNNTFSGNNINNHYNSVNVRFSNYNTIIDNNITNNFNGVGLWDSSFNTITGNNIFNTINSMWFDGSNNIISGNNISNNKRGLSIGGSSYSNIVSFNYISSNNESGIRGTGSHNIISNNTISHNADGLLLSQHMPSWTRSNNFTITDNTIISNNGNGLEIWNSSFATISGNNISNNENGIRLIGSRSATISGNTISSNSNDGISLFPFIWGISGEPEVYHHPITNNQIIGNLISDNGENGIILGADFRYWFKSRNNKILENNIINNTQDAFIENAFLNRWNRNYWNDGRLLPKPIFGVIQKDYDTIEIPWFNIDWRPALKPYDI